jgi:hypothetical protein
MKRTITATSIALALLALIFIGTSISTANIATEDSTDTADAVLASFQVIPMELPEIDADTTPSFGYLSDGTFEKILEEKTEFEKETRPLLHMLKSKWADLGDELSHQSSGTITATRLQDEISDLDTRLTEMRLDHLMALNDIKENAVN